MIWRLSWRSDPGGRVIADRHYNRQSVGAHNFVPPGRCLVLRAPGALWVTSWPFAEFTKHEWGGAWVNSTFRRESGDVPASQMIREAIAATRFYWSAPDLGMVTFVDETETRQRRSKRAKPGRCYEAAGFRHVGFTKVDHLWAWQMVPADMPPAEPPFEASFRLFTDPAPTRLRADGGNASHAAEGRGRGTR